jgi:serine phosphatase RsbU (regulator of sigma subunit)
LHTDGLSEARNSEDDEYGSERLADLASQHHDLSPSRLVATCIGDLEAHRNSQANSDDVTLMVIQRRS